MEGTTIILLFLQMLLAGSCFYLLLCADPNSNGILGRAHRFVYKFIPSLYNKKKGESGEKQNILFRIADRVITYLCYTNHPLVQVFYVLVAGGGFCVYWYYGFHKNFPNSQVDEVHTHIGTVMAFFCFYTYYLACKVSPGQVTKDNFKQLVKKYEPFYDDIIFEKNNKCTTCSIPKPARSKHCKTCNMCVSKFDHHCIWIKQCVGQSNYKYFLLFIGSHAILTLYGGVIGVFCLYGIVVDNNLLKAKFRVPGTDEISDATWSIIVKYVFYKETMYVFIIVLCIVMGVTLTIFLQYHFSMIKDNMTTNERIKRSDFMDFLTKEINRIQKVLLTFQGDQGDQSKNGLLGVKEKTDAEKEKEASDTVSKTDLQAKLKKYSKDYEILKKWFPNKGFKANLAEIINA